MFDSILITEENYTLISYFQDTIFCTECGIKCFLTLRKFIVLRNFAS